jgi:hypothetical protein
VNYFGENEKNAIHIVAVLFLVIYPTHYTAISIAITLPSYKLFFHFEFEDGAIKIGCI